MAKTQACLKRERERGNFIYHNMNTMQHNWKYVNQVAGCQNRHKNNKLATLWKQTNKHYKYITFEVLFLSTKVLQGSVATRINYGRIFIDSFTVNLPQSVKVKEFWKSVSISQSYRQNKFVTLQMILLCNCSVSLNVCNIGLQCNLRFLSTTVLQGSVATRVNYGQLF